MGGRLRTLSVIALAGFLMIAIQGNAAAEEEKQEKLKIASFVDELAISGDLRLREETQWYDDDGGHVNRQRFRLRLATDIKEGPIRVHIRLASGSGDQVSTNQSFQALSSEKGIWIDRAYVELLQVPNAVFMGGRMANPFFMNGTSGIVWDDDYNPEGFAQSYTMKLNDMGRLFVTAGEIVLDGGGSGASSQWLLGFQGGTEIKTDPAAFNLAVLYYTLANGDDGTLSQVNTQHGNSRDADGITLVNPYHVVHATAAGKFKIVVPVVLSADFVRNMSDTDQGATTDENTGFAVGIVIGKASDPNTVEFGYEYRSIDTDATLADLNDSDFGPDGGTNREGHKVWAAYNLTKAVQTKVTVFNSKVKNEDLPPAPISADDANPSHFRIQGDVSVKF